MKKYMNPTITIVACMAAVALDCVHFGGTFGLMNLVDFSFCLVVFAALFMKPAEFMAVCITCGFLLDTVSHTHTHLAMFLVYAFLSRELSRIFFSSVSTANVAAHIIMMALFQGASYALAFAHTRMPAPVPGLLLSAAGANAAIVLAAAVAASRSGKKFTEYMI